MTSGLHRLACEQVLLFVSRKLPSHKKRSSKGSKRETMEREKDFLHTSQCIVCSIVIRKGGRVNVGLDKIDGGQLIDHCNHDMEI